MYFKSTGNNDFQCLNLQFQRSIDERAGSMKNKLEARDLTGARRVREGSVPAHARKRQVVLNRSLLVENFKFHSD